MRMNLEEYRAYIEGRRSLAEIEAQQVTRRVTPVTRPCDPAPQVAQIVQPHPADWSGRLPYPPTANTYYRHLGNKVLISKRGRQYRKAVCGLLDGCTPLVGRLRFRVDVYPPDLRRRDLDNLLKGLQDALTAAGLLADDSDIKRLEMEMHDDQPDRPKGHIVVTVSRLSGGTLDGQSKGEDSI